MQEIQSLIGDNFPRYEEDELVWAPAKSGKYHTSVLGDGLGITTQKSHGFLLYGLKILSQDIVLYAG